MHVKVVQCCCNLLLATYKRYFRIEFIDTFVLTELHKPSYNGLLVLDQTKC
jgi:hypothetical protein